MLVLSAASAAAADVASPLGPAEALAHFQLEPGLAIELVACEPAVVDPIAIRFDEDGRLWVVEMRDYPHGPQAGGAPSSRICLLSDVDGDGRYETSQVFAEELLFPTGLQPWRGGLIVTLAGEVIYLKDTDGDGRADHREVWFQGFAAENPQLRANHPRFGFDNRVYIANGLRGGAIVDPRRGQPQQPLSISGMDFCFDPLTGACEAVSGNGQFGLTFDDFGNRFVCNNRAPLDHVVLENRYLGRNPFLAVPSVLSSVAAGGEQSQVFPLTSAWTTSNLHAGQFTAACGVEIYRGDALGEAYRTSALVCEPTGSLVHREKLTASGVTFVSQAASQRREFLASRDAWFRPVNLETGPDGALYVVDMYRAVIEHPQYMPSELQQRPDLRLGDDRGRIYRVVRAGEKLPRPQPKLSQSSSAELVELLRHKNSWWRDTASRLLYERQDHSAVAALDTLARKAPEASARVHALWALQGLGALSATSFRDYLADEHPRVREHAVLLAEKLVIDNSDLRSAIKRLAADADARVRFQTALVLGGLPEREIIEPLLAVALAAADDVWTRRAVGAALPQNIAPLALAALAMPRLRECRFDAAEPALVRELTTIVGSRGKADEMASVLGALVEPAASGAVCDAALVGLTQGIARRGGVPAAVLAQILGQSPDVQAGLNELFNRTVAATLDAKLEAEARGMKIDLLKYAGMPSAGEALVQIALNDPVQALRVRAAAALAPYGAKTGQALLAEFSAQTPAMRRAVLDALVANRDSAALVLDAVESGNLARAELDAARQDALRKHADATVRQRAASILAPRVAAGRKQVLAQYQAALELEGDPRAGKELFRKHCAGCHRIGDLGVNVAPDISDSRVKTLQQLLVDILNPNQAIDNNYASYTVVTNSGTLHTGIIAVETASSITLRQAENKSLDLLRADIESIRSNGVSLMPEGFEKDLDLRQLADVICFVKNWRYLEQAVGGTIPATEK